MRRVGIPLCCGGDATLQIASASPCLLNLEESSSYIFIYSGLFGADENDPILLKWLVGAGGFEPPTPCAQGSFRCFAESPYFQLLTIQGVRLGLLKLMESS